jgi:prevent-host-death family protein
MVSVTGEQLQKTSGFVRAEARRAPVEVTYHGRPELVILSVEDYALLRQNRKLALTREELPAAKIARIAGNRMDAGHADLDQLMDD